MSVFPAYADETSALDINTSSTPVLEKILNSPILKGNDRYRYTTRTEYKYLRSNSFYVSAKDAASQRAYDSALRRLAASYIPGGGKLLGLVVGLFASNYYSSPTAAVGNYTITTYSAKEIKTNVLTKKSYISRSGYKITLSHNGKSTTRTYWL